MSTTWSALRIPKRFAIEIEIPSRGLSDGAAETKKGRAARTRAGEKYISTRSGLAEDADSKEAETGDDAGCRMLPFYTQDGVHGLY
jgi:hypothetical protein